jgi:hypothetical protein
MDVSSYVLTRALAPARLRFTELVRTLGESQEDRYVLAALNDLLGSLAPMELPEAVKDADVSRLSPFLANYVAAMVEQSSYTAATAPPAWVQRVLPLEKPHFTERMKSLRLHLLGASPVPFKKRNIFVDSGVGNRV